MITVSLENADWQVIINTLIQGIIQANPPLASMVRQVNEQAQEPRVVPRSTSTNSGARVHEEH